MDEEPDISPPSDRLVQDPSQAAQENPAGASTVMLSLHQPMESSLTSCGSCPTVEHFCSNWPLRCHLKNEHGWHKDLHSEYPWENLERQALLYLDENGILLKHMPIFLPGRTKEHCGKQIEQKRKQGHHILTFRVINLCDEEQIQEFYYSSVASIQLPLRRPIFTNWRAKVDNNIGTSDSISRSMVNYLMTKDLTTLQKRTKLERVEKHPHLLEIYRVKYLRDEALRRQVKQCQVQVRFMVDAKKDDLHKLKIEDILARKEEDELLLSIMTTDQSSALGMESLAPSIRRWHEALASKTVFTSAIPTQAIIAPKGSHQLHFVAAQPNLNLGKTDVIHHKEATDRQPKDLMCIQNAIIHPGDFMHLQNIINPLSLTTSFHLGKLIQYYDYVENKEKR